MKTASKAARNFFALERLATASCLSEQTTNLASSSKTPFFKAFQRLSKNDFLTFPEPQSNGNLRQGTVKTYRSIWLSKGFYRFLKLPKGFFNATRRPPMSSPRLNDLTIQHFNALFARSPRRSLQAKAGPVQSRRVQPSPTTPPPGQSACD
jgi:hypothetical protein